MNKTKRKPLIVGNWKMNKTPSEAAEFTKDLLSTLPSFEGNCEVVVCPPFTALPSVSYLLSNTAVKLGAQNCHFKTNGAYTGEISAQMLTELDCSYVIIGHSERRAYFAETDETVNKRLLAAMQSGLTAILCVGEALSLREEGTTTAFISKQISSALNGVSVTALSQLVIAYEPIWAIGTGQTATPQQAQEVCKNIRVQLTELFGLNIAENIRILYGGSMNEKNAAELLSEQDIDGGLIGGAALKAEDFSAIVRATL